MLANDLRDAIENTLDEYWRDYSDEKKPTFLKDDDEVNPRKMPAIGLYDIGSTTNFETMRGTEDDGSTKAGVVSEDYQFNLMIYIKGSRRSSLIETINDYRDALKAIIQDKFAIGTAGATANVSNDEPSIEWPLGSTKLQIARVRVVVNSWTLQGSGELLEEADL